MVSHVNDNLQVPIMLPITCRPVAARYLVIALAQIALGRLADRSSTAAVAAAVVVTDTMGDGSGVAYRGAIVEALRPWARNRCPRVRKEMGRALFQLCLATAAAAAAAAVESAAPAAAAATSTRTVAALVAEEAVMREVVKAGAFSEVKGERLKMPAGEQSLAALDTAVASLTN